jgi:hypothetical protein
MYRGDFVEGLKTGEGVLMTPIFEYRGKFKDNLFFGQGKLMMNEGGFY